MLEKLNNQQREAVTSQGHILLTACPGSGKTRVLANKVGYEIKMTEESKKIVVALTFTNRAAEEIQKRLSQMDIDSSRLFAGTIHSFCLHWILRPHCGYMEELKNGFVVADEYKSDEILNDLKDNYGISPFAQISTKINLDGTLSEESYPNIVHEYHTVLRKLKLIDFDQILFLSYSVLQKFPKIAETLNNIFHIICVDEYQDTQELQYSILASIISAGRKITTFFAVGDSDQAIYGSLGGVAKTLDQISQQFDIEITSMELSGNYRSNQRIIDYYRSFQTADIEIKSLLSDPKEYGQIAFANQDIHHSDLSKVIADLIKDHLTAGVPESEICVLAPQWWLVIPMGRKLKNLLPTVNFDAIGLSPLIRNKENIWFKFARLFLVSPSPRMFLIRKRWANELIQELEDIGISRFTEEGDNAKLLLKICNSIHSEKTDGLEYLEDCFQQMLSLLGLNLDDKAFIGEHWNYFFEGTRKRLENPDFDYAKDIDSFKRVFNHSDGVVVNTCHGIKGEEFQVVIAFGILEGYIPHKNDSDPYSAAKKLLYVICSRAKSKLFLISESGRVFSGSPRGTTAVLNNLKYNYDSFF